MGGWKKGKKEGEKLLEEQLGRGREGQREKELSV
jgi:hypothetical protein